MAIVYLFLFQILLPAFEMAVVKPEKLQPFMDKRVLLQINHGREVRNFEFNLHGLSLGGRRSSRFRHIHEPGH